MGTTERADDWVSEQMGKWLDKRAEKQAEQGQSKVLWFLLQVGNLPDRLVSGTTTSNQKKKQKKNKRKMERNRMKDATES